MTKQPSLLARGIIAFDRLVGPYTYRIHVAVYRGTRGVIGHWSPAGPILLLTTVGRRTGQKRTNPLVYLHDGERYLVVGSNGGRDRPPAWQLNLAATPAVELQVGRRHVVADAAILSAEEKVQVWSALVEHNPGWENYQGVTDRMISVIALTERR